MRKCIFSDRLKSRIQAYVFFSPAPVAVHSQKTCFDPRLDMKGTSRLIYWYNGLDFVKLQLSFVGFSITSHNQGVLSIKKINTVQGSINAKHYPFLGSMALS